MKRKNASGESQHTKRIKLETSDKNTTPNESNGQRTNDQVGVESTQQSGSAGSFPAAQKQAQGEGENKDRVALMAHAKHIPQPSKRRENIRKLAPPRPFPSVPASVSASGPKSAHKEGKNLICITRHTSLATYLGRCKKLLVEEGYNVLHLHAMGAAIPHLLTLSITLPKILPFAKDDIRLEVRTGTIEVLDEVIPDDEDEDITVRTREKGGVNVIIKILEERSSGNGRQRKVIVVKEGEQDEMDSKS